MQKQTTTIEKAAVTFRAFVTYPDECPECCSTGDVIEDNGETPTSRDLCMLCTWCGHQWEPNQ
jgi:hypothetical protein